MATHLVQETINVPINGTDEYFLTVLIGNGQAGSTNYQDFDGVITQPDVSNALIGHAADISGKSRKVASVVMEINPNDNDMIVSYFVTEGQADPGNLGDPAGVLTITAGEGDTVTFITTLNFV